MQTRNVHVEEMLWLQVTGLYAFEIGANAREQNGWEITLLAAPFERYDARAMALN
jgi:hypothetical protein